MREEEEEEDSMGEFGVEEEVGARDAAKVKETEAVVALQMEVEVGEAGGEGVGEVERAEEEEEENEEPNAEGNDVFKMVIAI